MKEGSTNLALIGSGRWGKNLARNFYQLGALHTICDIDESVLDRFRDLYPDVHFSANYRAVLANPLILSVAIAAPAIHHYKLAKEALLAGKDVYVEKPLCLDCREAEELISLASETGRILMVGHLLHYHPCVECLQESVGKGELGQLQYIVSNRLNLGAIRTEENALWNFAPHDVSVILSLCGGCLPEEVRCTGGAYVSKGVADTTLTTLQFRSDIRAHIYVSWLNPFKEQKLTVVGSHAMMVFDDTASWENKLIIYRNHLKWSKGTIPLIDNTSAERVIVPQLEPLKAECAHFLQCCSERVTPKTDGKEGLATLRVLQAAQASLNVDGEKKKPAEHHFISEIKKLSYFVHSSAVVDSQVTIGKETKIWHFSHIMERSQIGEGCTIGQNVVVFPEVVLGKNVKVQNNVSIYTGVSCEDDVFLGPSMVFTNIINPRSEVSRKALFGKTLVRKGATIGANATILTGIELGTYSFVGAGAVVTKSVKPFALVIGNPARQVGWMSRYGERLDLPVSALDGESLFATCPKTGEEFCLEKDSLTLVKKCPSLSNV